VLRVALLACDASAQHHPLVQVLGSGSGRGAGARVGGWSSLRRAGSDPDGLESGDLGAVGLGGREDVPDLATLLATAGPLEDPYAGRCGPWLW
jgi:hypothetical protein